MTVMFVTRCSYGPQRERFAHDLVQVHHRARALPLAREREELAHDLRGALGFVKDDLDPALRAVVQRLLDEALGPREHRGERVVQLVRDAGNRLSQRGHLLGLHQLLIQIARLVVELLSFADVADERVDVESGIRA